MSKFRFNANARVFERCEVELPVGMKQIDFMRKFRFAFDNPESDEAKEIEKMGITIIGCEKKLLGPYPVSGQKKASKETAVASE